MNDQVNRKRLPQAQTGETPLTLERFAVHTLGHVLKQERLNRGMSRALLTARTQIAPKRLSGLESNAAVPSLPEIGLLAEAFGVEREVLLRELGLLRT